MTNQLRKLHINLDLLADYLDLDPTMGFNHFLDLETGEVVGISEDDRWALEELFDNDDIADVEVDLPARLAQTDYTDQFKEQLLLTYQIGTDFRTRFLPMPQEESHEAYADMAAFVETIADQSTRARLAHALEGRGAFRRFRDIVFDDRRLRDRWHALQNERRRERMRTWLEEEGFDVIHTPPPPPEPDPTVPTPRQALLLETLLFTAQARELPGVQRIALIGSLTTQEPDPSDADLLVTVADDMDLEPLATLGRKLSGRMQGINRGGEIFLADAQGNYLGRTCRWKRCEPYIRARCEAQHCARRQYLYDDFQNLRLAKELVAQPPVELWPQVVTRVDVPADLETMVLAQLRQE